MPTKIPEGHKAILLHVPEETHAQLKKWAERREESLQALLCALLVAAGRRVTKGATQSKPLTLAKDQKASSKKK
jgi:hypothetical protein